MHKRIAMILSMVIAASAAAAVPTRYVSLADAEREFATAGRRDGVQRSFLAHFADDAVVLKPFAVPAPDWYRAHPDRPGTRLIWAPQYLAVSAAGDLGLSSGPWRFEAEKDGKPVRADGHFFSIWRRQAGGKWLVVFDHGVSHAQPAAAVEATALAGLHVDADQQSAAVDTRRAALLAADDVLRERLRADPGTAYSGLARDDTLWLRDGALPVQSSKAPVPAKGICGCGPRVAVGVAASGDLAYTIGGAAGERERGADVRVWRFDGEHGWMLLAELGVPAA